MRRKLSLTVKTDDVTKGRKDLDPHGRFRGEWVKVMTVRGVSIKWKYKWFVIIMSLSIVISVD